jgi:tetratricopeptide (TPR) repeat protein
MCLGRFDEAIECFNKAININPQNGLAYYYKGYTLYCLGQCDEALECFNEAKITRPDDIMPYDELA